MFCSYESITIEILLNNSPMKNVSLNVVDLNRKNNFFLKFKKYLREILKMNLTKM